MGLSRIVIDHVSLNVRDARESIRFYETVLAPLGIPALWESPNGAQFANLVVTERGPLSGPTHVAFVATSREQVADFHQAGIGTGYRDNGGPGVRERLRLRGVGLPRPQPDGEERARVSDLRGRARDLSSRMGARANVACGNGQRTAGLACCTRPAHSALPTLLCADGHDVTALTLPGLESPEADRCTVTFADHVDVICDAVTAAGAPVLLAVHSGASGAGHAVSDRIPERVAAMVYVDSGPATGALDPDFAEVEKPMPTRCPESHTRGETGTVWESYPRRPPAGSPTFEGGARALLWEHDPQALSAPFVPELVTACQSVARMSVRKVATSIVTVVVVAMVVGSGAGATSSADPALARALQRGGLVLALRHAATDFSKPDQDPVVLSDCRTQRNLNARGRAESRAIGRGVRRLGLRIGTVLASPFCRTKETARLAFGRFRVSQALLNTIVAEHDARWRRQMRAVRRLIGTRPARGTLSVLVTHGSVVEDATRHTLAEGETIVYRPLGSSRFRLVGRILASEWRTLRSS